MASSITTEFKKVGHGVPTETLTLGEEYINKVSPIVIGVTEIGNESKVIKY